MATPPLLSTWARKDVDHSLGTMTDSTAQTEVDEWIPAGSVPSPAITTPEYKGRRTSLIVARNVLHGPRDLEGHATGDPRLVGRGEKIEFWASFDKRTGRWYGPEAAHVENLISLGVIAGTPRANEIDGEIARMENEWGASGPNAEHPELAQFTRDRLYDVLRHFIEGGLRGRKSMEGTESRADRANETHAAALNNLADAIKSSRGATPAEKAEGFDIQSFLSSMSDEQAQALADAILTRQPKDPLVNDGEWAGAQGPGSNPTAAAQRRAQKEK